KACTIDIEAFTPRLKSLKWTLPLRNQDGSPLWGIEENGLMQECCNIIQPT
ncbi:mCG113526, isoform CRA_c, partial [Mus musculus]